MQTALQQEIFLNRFLTRALRPRFAPQCKCDTTVRTYERDDKYNYTIDTCINESCKRTYTQKELRKVVYIWRV